MLYESSGTIHLPIADESVPLTRRQRRAAQDARVLSILAQDFPTPSDRVSTAYFDGVKGIRRRVETVLTAVLGEDARIAWLYSKDGPSDIRSKLVHLGWSEVDVAHACDVASFCHQLGLLIREIVERILMRAWRTPLELPRRTYSKTLLVVNTIPIGTGIRFGGDFTITLQLLALKGVLRF